MANQFSVKLCTSIYHPFSMCFILIVKCKLLLYECGYRITCLSLTVFDDFRNTMF
uniref:Uncharacterized protein n=1 Tax=Rhizophora mucronata TaxID=61149 RepID=A0A2P2QS43_RHIMU